MKKSFLRIVYLFVLLFFVFQKNMVQAATASVAPTASEVTITNNVGTSDTIYITGVMSGDVVSVYNAATGGKLIGKATVGKNKTDVTIKIAQIGTSEGSVYISVTSSGMTESSRTKIDYDEEPTSYAPLSANITITNNSGKPDTVYVAGLAPGDVVKIYNAATGGQVLGSATVAGNTTDVTKSFTQLGTAGGSVYISVTSKGMHESDRVEADFSAESMSNPPQLSNVTITNNSGKADTIYVAGLAPGDVVKIYNAAVGGVLLGSATVGSNNTDVTKSFTQLGVAGGYVYISVTSKGMHESIRNYVSFPAENQSNSISESNVTITNNTGKADTVYVSGLAAGDEVNIYNAASGGQVLGTATVGTSSTDATVSISQLGTDAGSVYISVTSSDMLEGSRVKVDYSAESQSSNVDADNVVVSNNSGKADTVYVPGLNAGDLVKVYDSAAGGNLLGSATVASGSTNATISITQLGTGSGSVYISVTGTAKLESSRIQASYSAEGQSAGIDANNVIVSNNAGNADTVQVTGLSANDIINIYDAAKAGNLLGSATVGQYDTKATITISQLGTEAGSIYISRTNTNKQESSRVQVDYAAENRSDAIDTKNISVTNNAVGTADVVKVTDLSANDVVNVYDLAKGGNLLGTATVSSGSSEVTISIAQLGTTSGSVYVSVVSSNKAESDRAEVDYSAEPTSDSPKADNIVITNNAGIADTVQVNGLSVNDVVNVYDSAKGGNLLGTATVASYETGAAVSIGQLGTDAGNIYVSVTSTGKLESSRTQVAFDAEVKSDAPAANKVTIVNNAGMPSTVKVTGLYGNDVINVYNAAQGGTLLGSATVGTYDTDATVSITQLGSDAGSVYVTITSTGKLESDRTQVNYVAKTASSAPNANYITVVNNAGIADTVKVTNLQPNDVVNIYNSAEGGSLLGSATVTSDGMAATITITQLGVDGGNIYVSIKSTGKIESSRTPVVYSGESKSDAAAAEDITIVNNSGTADTVEVDGLAYNDVVTVYSAAEGGNTLGTATVASGDSEAIVSISQLGSKSGSVYVSVTRSGKTESDRTEADYLSESTAPVTGNISIINNAVIDDTVTVSGLVANDVVRVYDAAQNGNLLGSGVVSANSTTATISIAQLTTTAGSVYVSVTNFGKSESNRTKADYISEQKSTPLYVGSISVTNNTDTDDIITVSNLIPSSVVKVYDAASGGNLIGIGTASSNGNQITINISQLSTGAGSVYLTVTTPGKNESSRTEADYVGEK